MSEDVKEEMIKEGGTEEPQRIKVDAVMWSPGIIYPILNGAPEKLYADSSLSDEVYEKVLARVRDGGLPITIDHLDQEELEILKELGYGVVGRVTGVELRDGRVHATEITFTGEAIPKLIKEGLMKALSIEAYIETEPVRDGYRITGFRDVTGVSIVKKPACPSCLVYRLNAYTSDEKLSVHMKFTPGGETMKKEEELTGSTVKAQEEVPEEDEGVGGAVDVLPELIDRLNEVINELRGLIEEIQNLQPIDEGEEGEQLTEGLADELKEKAATINAKKLVEKYIEEGKVKPAETEAHIKLAMKAPAEYSKIMDEAPQVIEMSRMSRNPADMKEKEFYTYEEYRKRFHR